LLSSGSRGSGLPFDDIAMPSPLRGLEVEVEFEPSGRGQAARAAVEDGAVDGETAAFEPVARDESGQGGLVRALLF